MKRIYEKPVARVEYFALSQSIANTCGANSVDLGFATLAEKTTCGWDIGGDVYWTSENNGCAIKILPDTDVGGVCYHNPEGGVSVFNS